jgi:uncharacterized metal-binding protein
MWRYHHSIAVRGIVRHRLYSATNIVGLVVRLTCLIVVLLIAWVKVCGNTLRLASMNPVHALRYE